MIKAGRRRHKGDIMAAATRSAVMARIKGKDTGPERKISAAFSAAGLKYECQVRRLPGRPDFVFGVERLAVFVEGDFWHGWRFPQWRDKLSEAWEEKIASNRARDARNHQALRRNGWKVIRLWEHQIDADLQSCVTRVLSYLRSARTGRLRGNVKTLGRTRKT